MGLSGIVGQILFAGPTAFTVALLLDRPLQLAVKLFVFATHTLILGPHPVTGIASESTQRTSALRHAVEPRGSWHVELRCRAVLFARAARTSTQATPGTTALPAEKCAASRG